MGDRAEAAEDGPEHKLSGGALVLCWPPLMEDDLVDTAENHPEGEGDCPRAGRARLKGARNCPDAAKDRPAGERYRPEGEGVEGGLGHSKYGKKVESLDLYAISTRGSDLHIRSYPWIDHQFQGCLRKGRMDVLWIPTLVHAAKGTCRGTSLINQSTEL